MSPRDTRTAYRSRQKGMEQTVDAAVAAVKAEETERYRRAREAAREAEASRRRFTREEILGARAVRDRYGWHRVVRVNKTTVSVAAAGYSWTDRIQFDKVLEVRHA